MSEPDRARAWLVSSKEVETEQARRERRWGVSESAWRQDLKVEKDEEWASIITRLSLSVEMVVRGRNVYGELEMASEGERVYVYIYIYTRMYSD